MSISVAAFSKGLSLVGFSELGDKTFFIAAILAMRHQRRWVFPGVVAALVAMTIVSVTAGSVVALINPEIVRMAAIVLFVLFGVKLLYDGWQMSAAGDDGEETAAGEVVEAADAKLTDAANLGLAILTEAFVLTFIAEWGDRTQFTTIALAAAYDAISVTIGAICGHTICAILAVSAGKAIAGRISERTITLLGGGLFLAFGVLAYLKIF
jgi:putative Ca2+/H+ antiporter (TMEM165/GDT1 family)